MHTHGLTGDRTNCYLQFAGHAVIPSLAKDMKEPQRFDHMINTAFVRSQTLALLLMVDLTTS